MAHDTSLFVTLISVSLCHSMSRFYWYDHFIIERFVQRTGEFVSLMRVWWKVYSWSWSLFRGFSWTIYSLADNSELKLLGGLQTPYLFRSFFIQLLVKAAIISRYGSRSDNVRCTPSFKADMYWKSMLVLSDILFFLSAECCERIRQQLERAFHSPENSFHDLIEQSLLYRLSTWCETQTDCRSCLRTYGRDGAAMLPQQV